VCGLVEKLLLQAAVASHLPVAAGDLLYEQVLDLGSRLQGLAESFEVEVKVLLALDDARPPVTGVAVAGGDDRVAGEKSVAG